MKQIKITTSKGEFLVVDEKELPKIDKIIISNDSSFIKLSEITELEASEIVDYSILKNLYASYNYGFSTDSYVYKTAIESLHSLLKSKGINDLTNKYIFKL